MDILGREQKCLVVRTLIAIHDAVPESRYAVGIHQLVLTLAENTRAAFGLHENTSISKERLRYSLRWRPPRDLNRL